MSIGGTHLLRYRTELRQAVLPPALDHTTRTTLDFSGQSTLPQVGRAYRPPIDFFQLIAMTVASCNACDRKRERSVNSRCLYVKAALATCVSLGVSTDEFKFYIPEIVALPFGYVTEQESSPHTGWGPLSQPFPLLAEDVMALLQDNAECKKRISETQHQLDQVLSGLDALTLGALVGSHASPVVTSANEVPSGREFGLPITNGVATTTTARTMITQPTSITCQSTWSTLKVPGLDSAGFVRPSPTPALPNVSVPRLDSVGAVRPPPGLSAAHIASHLVWSQGIHWAKLDL